MHVRRALALALAVPLLLAGCSDNPEPTPKMPDPTTSTPSPTEAETPEAESAEDFIRRWVEAGDEMQVTGEVGEFRRMSRGCTACADLIANVQEVYASGGSIQFDGTEIVRLESMSQSPPTFELDLDTPVTRVVDASGAEQQSFPAGVGKYVITLKKQGAGWRVTHYGRR